MQIRALNYPTGRLQTYIALRVENFILLVITQTVGSDLQPPLAQFCVFFRFYIIAIFALQAHRAHKGGRVVLRFFIRPSQGLCRLQ